MQLIGGPPDFFSLMQWATLRDFSNTIFFPTDGIVRMNKFKVQIDTPAILVPPQFSGDPNIFEIKFTVIVAM